VFSKLLDEFIICINDNECRELGVQILFMSKEALSH
jgi:hypothetical protein